MVDHHPAKGYYAALLSRDKPEEILPQREECNSARITVDVSILTQNSGISGDTKRLRGKFHGIFDREAGSF